MFGSGSGGNKGDGGDMAFANFSLCRLSFAKKCQKGHLTLRPTWFGVW